MQNNDYVIEITDISKKYGHITALENISLKVRSGKRTVIVGPSGCGKTTLLRLIAGFEKIKKGRIIINGNLASDKSTMIVPNKRELGMVFQDLALWPHMTVEGNIAFALDGKKFSKSERNKKVDKVLQHISLEKYKKSYPHNLSGGEKQRVAIARAIVSKPKILLMDEPLANLDLLTKEEIEEVIINIQKESGITLLYVTHNQMEAKTLGENLIMMNEGKHIESGTVENMFNNPSDEFTKKFLKVKV